MDAFGLVVAKSTFWLMWVVGCFTLVLSLHTDPVGFMFSTNATFGIASIRSTCGLEQTWIIAGIGTLKVEGCGTRGNPPTVQNSQRQKSWK